MKISTPRLEIIKSYEGLRLQTYDDYDGKVLLTSDQPHMGIVRIGYGTNVNPSIGIMFKKGDIITEEKANEFLAKSISQKEGVINDMIFGKFSSGNFELNQNQFDALVMLIFNVGEGAVMRGKTIRNYLETNDFVSAAESFLLWCKINGVVSDKILERRKIEKEIFLTPVS